jgi:predicted nucleic acid-binding protein
VKTALDTNIISALLKVELSGGLVGEQLDQCASEGELIIFGAVYAELCAFFDRSPLDEFLDEMEIRVEEHLTRAQWRSAGEAFGVYQVKRRRSTGDTAKRFLVDFMIGTHAVHHADRLLTLDGSVYRAFFKNLEVLEIQT